MYLQNYGTSLCFLFLLHYTPHFVLNSIGNKKIPLTSRELSWVSYTGCMHYLTKKKAECNAYLHKRASPLYLISLHCTVEKQWVFRCVEQLVVVVVAVQKTSFTKLALWKNQLLRHFLNRLTKQLAWWPTFFSLPPIFPIIQCKLEYIWEKAENKSYLLFCK